MSSLLLVDARFYQVFRDWKDFHLILYIPQPRTLPHHARLHNFDPSSTILITKENMISPPLRVPSGSISFLKFL